MCLTCSDSTDALNGHDDYRSITWATLTAAAEAAGVTPAQALANAVATLAYGGEPVTIPDDGQATAAQIDAAIDEANDILSVTKGIAGVNVIKMEPERQFTLGVAMASMRPDVAKGVDGFRDFVGSDLLERTAWAWMAKSRRTGSDHSDILTGVDSTGHATVVESYIYRGPDWPVPAPDGSTVVVKAGYWLVGLLHDDASWARVKRGESAGLSPQGWGRRALADPSRLAELKR